MIEALYALEFWIREWEKRLGSDRYKLGTGMSYNTELALIPKKYAEIKSLIRISQSVQRDTA